jgi:TonB family protein
MRLMKVLPSLLGTTVIGGLLVVLTILGGCAGGRASRPGDEGSSSRTAREDAGPSFYKEHEVEVPARPVDPIRPVYPPRLRALGIEGEVEARVVVRWDGSVGGARLVESTHDDFTVAVREALREARFHPARRHGEPVSSWVTVRLHFRLEE